MINTKLQSMLVGKKWLLIAVFCLFTTSSCENVFHSERLAEREERIKDLEMEVSDIEEDFYLAFTALERIDSLLSADDFVNAKSATSIALTDLGEVRFFRNEDYAIDLMTLQSVWIDCAKSNFLRDWRYQKFSIHRDTIIKIFEQKLKKAN